MGNSGEVCGRDPQHPAGRSRGCSPARRGCQRALPQPSALLDLALMKLPPPPSTGLFFGDISSSLFHAGASHIFKGVLL